MYTTKLTDLIGYELADVRFDSIDQILTLRFYDEKSSLSEEVQVLATDGNNDPAWLEVY